MGTVVFDGDCGFCRYCVAWLSARVGDRIVFAPYQEVASRHPEIPVERFREAVHWFGDDGKTASGAHAVCLALAEAPGHRVWLALYRRVPGFAAVLEALYRLVAGNRPFFSRLTRLFVGPDPAPPSYDRISRWYLSALGAIYVVAFASWGWQLRGLVGAHGILPAAEYFGMVAERLGPSRFWLLPSLAWISQSDGFLLTLVWAGVLAGALLVAGIARPFTALAAWALYLSLVVSGDVFMGYQWEALLLEAGFLAIFLAIRPTALVVLMHRFLFFRLMVSSAVAKWASGDPTWRAMTALSFHFETQPLPTWLAWYAHALPSGILRGLTLFMFVVEGPVAFLSFSPRRVRFAACALQVALQMGILLTGNYTYFNWLTILLALLLLEDPRPAPAAPRPRSGPGTCFAMGLVFLLGGLQLLSLAGLSTSTMETVLLAEERFRLVNGYGLFAVMTTERDEIEIQGSRDGREWTSYEFPWKPGDPKRRPSFVAPYQPRLDWQAWFAALGSFEHQPWLHGLLRAILEGRKEPVALLGKNPFPESPPRYVRVVKARYRFSDAATKKATGAWWVRGETEPYGPVLELPKSVGKPARPAPADP